MPMRPFDYYKPQSFEEAFQYLTMADRAVCPVAGATDFIPAVRDELRKPDVVVDVKALPGLRDLQETEEGLYVGAAVTMNEIIRSELVRSQWDLLAQGAASMGNEQVRNRATIGGNICTASPAADTAPALLALEAVALIVGPDGERRVPIAEFFTGPKKNALKPDEILVGLVIPVPPKGTAGTYKKLSRRKAGDLSIVGVAVMAYPFDGGYRWRVAMGAVSPTPLRATTAEKVLNESHDPEAIRKATVCAFEACCPIDDIRSSADYRRAMVVRISRRAIGEVLEKLEEEAK